MPKAPTIQQFRRSFGTHRMLPGRWSGSAYRRHPHGFVLRPIVYTDHHHVTGQCDAKLMTDPTSDFHPHSTDPASSTGNPYLRPIHGELVTFYDSGRWVGPDGPWRQQMRNDMARVLRQIREHLIAEKRTAQKAAEAKRVADDARWQKARLALEGVQ